MSCLFIQTIFFPVDLKKADKSQLTDLLTRIEFLQANQALHKLIEDLFQKLTNAVSTILMSLDQTKAQIFSHPKKYLKLGIVCPTTTVTVRILSRSCVNTCVCS